MWRQARISQLRLELGLPETSAITAAPESEEEAQVAEKVDEAIQSISEHVRAKWYQEEDAEIDDEVLIVLRSSAHRREYLAFGSRRLYWHSATTTQKDDDELGDDEDDDVLPVSLTAEEMLKYSRLGQGSAKALGSPERARAASLTKGGAQLASEHGGTLTWLPYLTQKNAFDRAPTAAAEGIPHTTSNPLASRCLRDVAFALNRQGTVLAVPTSGNVLEVMATPIRFKNDQGGLEGTRLCAVLNGLREVLYPSAGRHSSVDWDVLDKVQIGPDKELLHRQEARRQRVDHMLLDDNGEPLSLFTPLDRPERGALKYKLGAGLTSYTKILSIGTLGFLLAALAALPTMRNNYHGGVLSAIGYTGIGELTSLGNRPPWSVTFWPTQGLDLLYTMVLMYTFAFMRRAASRLASEVDDGSIDASDFTVYCSRTPSELGASNETEEAAVASYRRFFHHVLTQGPHDGPVESMAKPSHYPKVPADCEISEIVLIKNDAAWLKLRRRLADTTEAKHVAEVKEQRPGSWQPKLCGQVVSVEMQGWLGSLSGYSANYYRLQITQLTEQLKILEEEMDTSCEVVGAFVTFNSTEAVDKVLYHLQPPSLFSSFATYVEDTTSFPYDLTETHDNVHRPFGSGRKSYANVEGGGGGLFAQLCSRMQQSVSEAKSDAKETAQMAQVSLKDKVSKGAAALTAASKRALSQTGLRHSRSDSASGKQTASSRLREATNRVILAGRLTRKSVIIDGLADVDADLAAHRRRSASRSAAMAVRAQGASARHGRIAVESALEPADYIWENLATQGRQRSALVWLSWLAVLLTIYGAMSLNLYVTEGFVHGPTAVPGVFTFQVLAASTRHMPTGTRSWARRALVMAGGGRRAWPCLVHVATQQAKQANACMSVARRSSVPLAGSKVT